MDIESRIALVNSFHSLRGKKLPAKGPEGVVAGVNSMFEAWVEAQISQLMREDVAAAAAAAFTPEEIAALKAMAQKILTRQNAPATPEPVLPQATPKLKPSMDHKKFQEGNQQILTLATQLARMDEARDSEGNIIEF